MSKTVNILIADDHALVRRGLKTLLERQAYFKVVAEAETGLEAIEKARELHPDIAILDIRMPGLSGIEVCRQIVSSVEGCKVIILTAYAEDELLFAAIQAGAMGYVLKLAGNNELIHAVERVSLGEGFLDSAMIETVFKEIHKATNVRNAFSFASLTPHEMQVLSLVSRGMRNRQIATILYLSEGTIRNYVSSLLAKLAVSNRAEAAAYAVEHSLDDIMTGKLT